MKSKTLAVLAGTLLFTSAAPTWAQDALNGWYMVKDPKELRDLYSNKTFRGSGWVAHYRADGQGILSVGYLTPVPRTWEVKADGRVCVTPADGSMTCSQLQRNRAHPNELMATNLTTGRSLMFKLEDGVPKF